MFRSLLAAYVFRLALLDDAKCTERSTRRCMSAFSVTRELDFLSRLDIARHLPSVRSFSQLASSHSGLQDESMV